MFAALSAFTAPIARAATVATPSFSPVAATYTSAQNVTITTTTTGATIKYTIDGTTPSPSAGQTYSGTPVNIPSTKTLKAMAYKTGSTNSAVNTGTYTINLPTAAAPTFSPVAGTYTSAQNVTISSTTTGATLKYTTDGSTPSPSAGQTYTAGTPVNIPSTATLKAMAYKTGYNNSTVTSGTYTITIPKPVISSPDTADTQTGASFTYQIIASNSPTSYSATGLPPGLSVNTATGLISGTPTRPGVYAVTIGATNGGGITTSILTLTILATLPYTTDFETADGYTLGSLNNQLGWSVTQGAAQVTATDHFSGIQSAQLAAGNPPASISQNFASGPSGGIVFFDFYAKPVADADLALSTTFSVEGARFAFAKSGSQGILQAYNGDGTGGGIWAPTPFAAALGAGNQTQDWKMLTVRLDFDAKTWDLYADGTLVGVDLGFINDSSPSLSMFQVQGNPGTASAIDYLYAGATNPLFADLNNDGIDDAWETAHGLSLLTNDRDLDPDGDGLTNVEEYLLGTNPSIADTDGDGLNDGLEVSLGTNPLIADSTGPALPVAGARLHLRADLGAIADVNGYVGRWINLANPGQDATQTDAGNQPRIIANQINGHPTVNFEQARGTVLNLPAGLMAGAMRGEGFVVVRKSATSAIVGLWAFGGSNGSRYPEYNGQLYDDFATNTWYQTGPAPGDLTSFHIYNVGGDETVWFQNFDGLTHYRQTGNTVAFRDQPMLGNSAGCGFDGDIAEVVIYDRVLTDAERDAIGVYLTSKYALPSIPVPAKPTLNARPITPTQADLWWSEPSIANTHTAAIIERQTGGGSFALVGQVSDAFSFTDTALAAGQTYTYRISLRSYAGTSPSSDPITVTTLTAPGLTTTGLRLWLRTTAGLPVNGLVARWLDKSGLANDAVQPQPGNQPQVVAGQLNGLPVVHFSASANDSLNLPNLMAEATGGEAFAVLRKTSTPNIVGLWAFGGAGGSRYPEGNGELYDDFATSDWIDAGPPPAGLTEFHLYNVGGDGTTWFQNINGRSQFRQTGNTVAFRPNPNIGDGQGSAFDGDLAEVVIYDHVLTSAERDAVGEYLTAKYAIPSIPLPGKPTLHAVAVSSTTADLWWSEVSMATTHTVATVERKTDESDFTVVAEVADASGYTDSGLNAGQTYSYRLTLRSYAGESPPSDPATITTPSVGAVPATGMRLWLRSTVGITSAGRVARWADQSGLGNDAVQSQPDNQPQIVMGQLNGLPVVHFDGNTSFFDLPNFMAGSTTGAGEVYVMLRASYAQGAQWRGVWRMGVNDDPHYPIANGAVHLDDDWGSTTMHAIGTPAAPLDQFNLYNIASSGSQWTCWLNGAPLFQTETNTVYFRDDPLLGRNSGDWFLGDIAEVIVYDRVLSDTEREMIGQYFTEKYRPGPTSVPDKPTLAACAPSGNRVELSWSCPSVAGMHTLAAIERQISGELFVAIATVSDASSYVDTDVIAGQTYTYRMTLGTYAGTSPYSDPVSVTPPTVAGLPTSGLRLWLQPTAGLPPSGPVARWADQSGHGNDAIQPQPGNQPQVVADQLNGLPAVHFIRAQSTFLNLPNLMAGAAGGEAFAIVRRTSTAEVVGFWALGGSSGSRYPDNDGDGHLYDDFATNAWYDAGPPPAELGDFHVYNVGGDATTWHLSIDGLTRFQHASNTVAFRTSPTLGNGGWCGFDGDIAEVVVYDHVLTNAERDAVNVYLVQKYSPASVPVPGKPALTAHVASSAAVDLAWSDPTAGATHTVATIELRIGAGGYSVVAQVGDATSCTDLQLAAGQTYTYRMTLGSYAGTSEYSDPVTVTIPTSDDLPMAGLRLWLRASAGLPASGPVARWADQSGHGNDAVQSQAVNQPQVVPNQLDGLPVVHFTRAQPTSLNLPNFLAGAGGGEAFAIVRRSSTTEVVGFWALGGSMGSRYPENDGDGHLYDDFATNAWYDAGPPPADLTQFHLYNVGGDATTWFLNFDGRTCGQHAGNTVAFRPDPALGNGGWCGFDGDVAEVIVYDHVLTSAERDAVGTYLNRKYPLASIPVPEKPTLAAYAASGTQVDLAWSCPSTAGVSTIATIERQAAGGDFIAIAEVSDSDSYTDTGLTVGQTYVYRMTLRRFAGTSAYSDPVAVTTVSAADLPATGLRLWLRATAGLPTSGPVERWLDQSSSGNDALQLVPGNQPVVVANQFNGMPVVHFDGNTNFFELPNVMAGSSNGAGEVFMIVRASYANPVQWRAVWRMGANPNPHFPTANHVVHIDDDWGSAYMHQVGTPAQPLDQFNLYNIASDSSQWVCRLNGAPLYQTGFNTFYFPDDPVLGRNGGDWFLGDIAEVIIYDRVLNDTERNEVAAYLARKYPMGWGVTDNGPPTAPTGLVASSVGANSFTLSWNASTDDCGVAGYLVFRDGVLLGFTSNTSYNVTGLTAGTTYSMTVRARDTSGKASELSPPLAVTPAVPWTWAADPNGDADGDGIPNSQDAQPGNQAAGRLQITIVAPAPGAVVP